MKKLLFPTVLALLGLCALYPNINIILWAAYIGMLWTLPWQGLVTASVFGPIGGALIASAIWLWRSRSGE
jgi:hypothetical protein